MMDELQVAIENPAIRNALESAGWFPDRQIDPSHWTKALASDGYSVVPEATAVLAALGGLEVVPPHDGAQVYWSGPILFEPLLAAAGESPRIRMRENQLDLALTPIAEWTEELVLLVASDGQFFAETTGLFLQVGRNLSSALRRLIVADTHPEPVHF